MDKSMQCICIVMAMTAAVTSCGSSGAESEISSGIDTVIVTVSDTLGILYGDSTFVLGTITQASWGADGRLYVLDGQFGRLAVYSGDLAFIQYVGRLGSGPGEFQYPQSFAFLSDGRFAVCDWGLEPWYSLTLLSTTSII